MMRILASTRNPLPKFVWPISLGLAINVGATTLPTFALAQMSSYEQQKVVQFLRTPRTEMKLDIFDGTNFVPGTDKTRAYNYMVDFINAMNKATRIVGTMTSHARGTTEGKAFLEEANKKLDFARAMQAAYPAFEKGETQPTAATNETATTETAPATDTGGTKMLARERQSVQQHLDILNTMEANGTFDGSAFASSVSSDASRSFYKSYAKSMQDATNALNKLTGDARRTDEGQELTENVKRRIALADTIYNAVASHKPAAAAEQAALPTAEERASITVHFEKIDALLASGPYDGTTFKDGTSMDAARGLLTSLSEAGNAAAKAFNALPAASQRSDDGRALVKKISEYQNKKRPIQNALNDYRRVRESIETAEANKRHEENVAACLALESSLDRSNIEQRSVVLDLLDFVRESETGWDDAHLHPSVQGLKEGWGEQAIQMFESCKRKNYIALAESGFACRGLPGSDPVDWCRTSAAYVKANEKEIAEVAAREKAIRPNCDAFTSSVITRKNRRSMKRLFQLAKNVNRHDTTLPDTIRFAETVEAACTKPEFEGLLQTNCTGLEPLDNPHDWCRAAVEAKPLLRQQIAASYETEIAWKATANFQFGNEEELLRSNGWMAPGINVTYANLFSYERMLTGLESNNRVLIETLDLLDVDPRDFSSYEDVLDAIDEATTVIKEKAGSWRETSVHEDFTGYVTRLTADKLVKNWHPDAKVEDTWLGHSEWNIERTGLGFIENRWIRSYVLLKLPEDPYCQLHSTSVTEAYDGNKFVQSSNMKTHAVRFQDCDRR